MKKLLVVVDMQKDFVDGILGTDEAVKIVPNVVKKIREWEGDIICTKDTHDNNYLKTREGKHLPIPHCIIGTEGHKIVTEVKDALKNSGIIATLMKTTFGSVALPQIIKNKNYDYIEFIGLCTDICVVSNVMLMKAEYPEIDIVVDASCCAGVTVESHNAALQTMKMCQVIIKEK